MQAQKNKIFGFCTVIALAIMFIASAIFIPIKTENIKAETITLTNNSTSVETSYGVDEYENADLQLCWNYLCSYYSSNFNKITYNSSSSKEQMLRQKKYFYHDQSFENYLYDNEELLLNNNYFFTYTSNFQNRFIHSSGTDTNLVCIYDYKTQTLTLNGNTSRGAFTWLELGSMYDWLPNNYIGALSIRVKVLGGSFVKGSNVSSSNYGNCFTLGLTDENKFTETMSGNSFYAYSYFNNSGGYGIKTKFLNYHEIANVGNTPILFIYSQGGCVFDNYKIKITLSVDNNATTSHAYELIEKSVYIDETNYDVAYNQGKADGQKLADDFNLTSIFWEIIDAPFRLIGQALNFDFLGINFADTIKVILTLLIVVGVIKIFL